jgi:hypothetical protein
MRYVIIGVVVAFTAPAAWGVLIQYSNESAEEDIHLNPGVTALIQVTMPVGCSTVSKIRFYTTTGASIKLVIYNRDRKRVWYYTTVYRLGEYWTERNTGSWCPKIPGGAKFYVGWEGISGVEAKLGVDRDTFFREYMWIMVPGPTPYWYHPDLDNETWMIGVFVTETPAVAPTSLGRVKALYQ